jgi:hypothetical protein
VLGAAEGPTTVEDEGNGTAGARGARAEDMAEECGLLGVQ